MQKNNGGPAFPVSLNPDETFKEMSNGDGMTLRDWFAGQALIGLSALSAHPQSPNIEGQANMAYELADAMLKEREK